MVDVRALASVLALLLGACATVPDATPPQIAITIDDLPVHGPTPPGESSLSIAGAMIAALMDANVPAYGFINGHWTEKQPETIEVLNAWRAAGIPLANHGWAHRHLNEMNLAQFEYEIARNEPLLKQLAGSIDWRWFRYPFLDEGETPEKRAAARQVLAKRSYRIADVTMDFSDWQWNVPYTRCSAAGDYGAIAELERLYLEAAREKARLSRKVARKLYGRDIPYVQLMHVGAMSARMMPRLLQLYRDEGFRFISLPDAQLDPVYAAHNDPTLPAPPRSWEQARAKGVEIPQGTDYEPKLAAMCQGSGPAVPTQ